jgi:hypothetical protein
VESPVQARFSRDAVLSDASPLRWRFGERLDEVFEDACRRHADRTAVAAADAERGRGS